MASKPVQRTLATLRENGYNAHVVEKWNQWAHRRQDFGGFADVLAYKEGESGVLAIQACADNGGDVSAHFHKLCGVPDLLVWLKAGNRCEIWGWGKRGAAGKRKLWTLRIVGLVVTAANVIGTDRQFDPQKQE